MPYISIIPQATDKISQSQPQILGNFVALGTILQPDQGQVSFVPQPAVPAIPATTIAMYSSNYIAPIPAIIAPPTLMGSPEININKTDGVNQFEFPITAARFNSPGFAYLPSGMIMKWGFGLANPNANTSVNYDLGNGVPVFNTVLIVQATLYSAGGGVAGDTIYWDALASDALQLTVYLATAPAGVAQSFTYLAIGY